jgi:hypothetical protein
MIDCWKSAKQTETLRYGAMARGADNRSVAAFADRGPAITNGSCCTASENPGGDCFSQSTRCSLILRKCPAPTFQFASRCGQGREIYRRR